jgi:hypothetical protein
MQGKQCGTSTSVVQQQQQDSRVWLQVTGQQGLVPGFSSRQSAAPSEYCCTVQLGCGLTLLLLSCLLSGGALPACAGWCSAAAVWGGRRAVTIHHRYVPPLSWA